ncbi:MAG: gas vesicle protein [Planctomycetes bacterium]|nr:gas vesicle protein [Planctomycetota bacterium]
MPAPHSDETNRLSLCEALDRILNKGAVVGGEVTVSVANIELLYLGLQLVVTSIETAREKALRPSAGFAGTEKNIRSRPYQEWR